MNNSTEQQAEQVTTGKEKRKKLSSFTSTFNPAQAQQQATQGEAIVITAPGTPEIPEKKEEPTMQTIAPETTIPVVQETSVPVAQTTNIPVPQTPQEPQQEEVRPGRKKRKDIREKKGVYLNPATAKWLDRYAFENNKREISDVTNEALELLRQVVALDLTTESAIQMLKSAKEQPATK